MMYSFHRNGPIRIKLSGNRPDRKGSKLMDVTPYLPLIRHALMKFGPIPEAEWEHNKHLSVEPLHLKKEQHFVKIGDVPDKLGFIVSGIFRVYYNTERGEERVFIFRSENRFLSAYRSVLESEPSGFGIQALEPSFLICLPLREYKRLLAESTCWSNVSRQYMEDLLVEKEQREKELLSIDATSRYLSFKTRYPDVENRVSQYHIASYLGITPVALSRIRKRLCKKKA